MSSPKLKLHLTTTHLYLEILDKVKETYKDWPLKCFFKARLLIALYLPPI